MVRLTFVIMFRIVKIISLLLLKSVYLKATVPIYLYRQNFLPLERPGIQNIIIREDN